MDEILNINKKGECGFIKNTALIYAQSAYLLINPLRGFDKMKRINEGCLAIIVKGACNPAHETNIGKIVTVGKFIGIKSGYGSKIWEVDQLLTYYMGDKHNFVDESYMERIDDQDDNQYEADRVNKKIQSDGVPCR